MTTQQLRREIRVASGFLRYDGIVIQYFRNDAPLTCLLESPADCVRALIAIGTIDEWYDNAGEITFTVDGILYNWTAYCDIFQLSQWDALSIAINYEYEKEVNKEIDASDIGKVIKKLL
jgi:hypothetical protein